MEKRTENSANLVLETLKTRLGENADEQQLVLDIERARVMLLCYCNIPLNAEMPEGLFEAWCMAAEQIASGAMGEVSSISEGDVSVSFKKDSFGNGTCGWRTIADKFKRMAV